VSFWSRNSSPIVILNHIKPGHPIFKQSAPALADLPLRTHILMNGALFRTFCVQQSQFIVQVTYYTVLLWVRVGGGRSSNKGHKATVLRTAW